MKLAPLTAVLLALAALPRPHHLNAQDANAVIGRASRVYRSLSSLRADFQQTIADKMIGTFESKGQLVQAGNNNLSMRFSDPDGDAIVIDGKHVWIYTPSTTPGQVIRLPIPNNPVYGPNLLAWILDQPAERYRSVYLRPEQLNNRAMDVVELTPNSSEMPFTRAVVWLDKDDALPRRIEIEEASGAKRTLILTRIHTNDQVNKILFTFEPPKGTRIVDRGDQG